MMPKSLSFDLSEDMSFWSCFSFLEFSHTCMWMRSISSRSMASLLAIRLSISDSRYAVSYTRLREADKV